MVDHWLFGVWPYIAAACLLIGPIVRAFAAWRSSADLRREFVASIECLWSDARWRRGVLAILAGHMVIVLFPSGILLWNRSPGRLLALEGALLAAGVLACVGLVGLLRHNIGRWHGRSLALYTESALLALVTLVMVSGLLLSIVNRWASSWAAATWPSYLASVLHVSPDISVVAQMPFLVRLHVASTLALITLLPFTGAVSLVLFPLSRVIGRLAIRAGHNH